MRTRLSLRTRRWYARLEWECIQAPTLRRHRHHHHRRPVAQWRSGAVALPSARSPPATPQLQHFLQFSAHTVSVSSFFAPLGCLCTLLFSPALAELPSVARPPPLVSKVPIAPLPRHPRVFPVFSPPFSISFAFIFFPCMCFVRHPRSTRSVPCAMCSVPFDNAGRFHDDRRLPMCP